MAPAVLLVVEDSAFFAALLLDALTEISPHIPVVIVESGLLALGVLADQPVAGVLLDVTLDGAMTGIEVLQHMRADETMETTPVAPPAKPLPPV